MNGTGMGLPSWLMGLLPSLGGGTPPLPTEGIDPAVQYPMPIGPGLPDMPGAPPTPISPQMMQMALSGMSRLGSGGQQQQARPAPPMLPMPSMPGRGSGNIPMPGSFLPR